ncbi:hypothetical protein HK098_006171 [Nowakowskiella sp. JEL0407]|nr:hypothetical protein HK098_006171 [Nowakowskiella sp. JEL0407]
MGIPKFFRWISERYPLCSHLIRDSDIPEYDNFYLDMNGIIHACSHPNDDNNAHFRITEEQIFINIFNYLTHLFSKIKPKKLFFMAVDGVAPRAKMNQQRSRRFRSAKDREDAKRKALAKGEKLPETEAFDSNCITPGTPFMVKLSEALQYFVHKKITEDSAWREVTVILSGHEVPGEGEHKIMEYIRHAKSQPDYQPNLRHCLYGLDADLIMLGLLSHEPHFSLLREEVTFGRSQKKAFEANPESINFYLFHLGLLREYLDLEFLPVKDQISFEYDFERVIDDFILLGFFVGNDFLPHLPKLHINEGALSLMFRAYKKILPEAGGYLHDHGDLNMLRLELLLRELAEYEKEVFLQEKIDDDYVRGKRLERQERNRHRKKIEIRKQIETEDGTSDSESDELIEPRERKTITTVQSNILLQLTQFVYRELPDKPKRLLFDENLPAKDRRFIAETAKMLNLRCDVEETRPGDISSRTTFVEFQIDEDSDDEEGVEARERVLKQLRSILISDEILEKKKDYEAEFAEWKKEYYREKLEFNIMTDEGKKSLEHLVLSYKEGLQWVLQYYYNGVQSWSWYFPYHYSPKISDLLGYSHISATFTLGTPFFPFEQLMGVLPAASKQHIPEAFRDLMINPNSPIFDFYPQDFDLDMNEKKADWEAVVKIVFIDQERLLKALKAREGQLTPAEKKRNSFGNAYIFSFDPKKPELYPSPGVLFPVIAANLCRKSVWVLPPIPDTGLRKGRIPGTCQVAGFPTMHTIPCTGSLGYHGVNVFNTESRNETMVITINSLYDTAPSSDPQSFLPNTKIPNLIGKHVYVNWPSHTEGIVVSMVTDTNIYRIEDPLSHHLVPWSTRKPPKSKLIIEEHTQSSLIQFERTSEEVENVYSRRYGTIIGEVEVLLVVSCVGGLKLMDDGALVKDFRNIQECALQMCVENKGFEGERYVEVPPLNVEIEYPKGVKVFMTGAERVYGDLLEVSKTQNNLLTLKLENPSPSELELSTITRSIIAEFRRSEQYTPSYILAKQLKMNPLILSRITSAFQVDLGNEQRYNLGLNLKFDSKQKKVVGYSRKSKDAWEFSRKAVELIEEYRSRFPDLFIGLEKSPKTDIFQISDIFGPEKCDERFNEIKTWLKESGCKELEKVDLDTEAVTKEYVGKLESAISEYYAQYNATKPAKNFVLLASVPRTAVLKPSRAQHRLQAQIFELGDRVVYVPDSGSVPLGAKGVVVGKSGRSVEVVFDEQFLGGFNLGGRCSESRGMLLTMDTVLNISNKQLLPGMKSLAPPSRPESQQNRFSPPRSPSSPYRNSNGNDSHTPQKNVWQKSNQFGSPANHSGESSPGPSTPIRQRPREERNDRPWKSQQVEQSNQPSSAPQKIFKRPTTTTDAEKLTEGLKNILKINQSPPPKFEDHGWRKEPTMNPAVPVNTAPSTSTYLPPQQSQLQQPDPREVRNHLMEMLHIGNNQPVNSQTQPKVVEEKAESEYKQSEQELLSVLRGEGQEEASTAENSGEAEDQAPRDGEGGHRGHWGRGRGRSSRGHNQYNHYYNNSNYRGRGGGRGRGRSNYYQSERGGYGRDQSGSTNGMASQRGRGQ